MRYDLNTAYDYNRISRDNAAPKRAPQTKAKIKTLAVKEHKTSAASTIALRLAVAVVILFMVCFNIYTRAEISDTQKQIDDAYSQIEELDSENIKLQMKMQSIISYTNLEQEAERLGMHKKTKAQIHYIDTSDDSHAEIVESGN